jgi:hypothetical protein
MLHTEETYRLLIMERYPFMRHQIGRAYAVAGYAGLYLELNLLPVVSIVDAARENCSLDIYEDTISHPG